ncbi:MAG: major capsid protein [Microviridae sp.]|nr:MAG: major capsid protein [Microviridae sp.]
MARQSTTPVSFQQTRRIDATAIMSSGRAGQVIPVAYIPLLRGDSASGRIGIDVDLAEMPRPLLNGVQCNMQAWFVPKPAHPQFTGYDEFMHSYQMEVIKTIGSADRQPPPFFHILTSGNKTSMINSPLFKTLGIHVPPLVGLNSDIADAYALIHNFRLAAFSSRLQRRKYAQEDIAEAGTLARAFWPPGRFTRVVPDYERALVVGSLDLDVTAGKVALTGKMNTLLKSGTRTAQAVKTLAGAGAGNSNLKITGGNLTNEVATPAPLVLDPSGNWESDLAGLFGSMAGETINTTLADIDKARTRQAFAKLRTAYAGNDSTGFDNDDVIVAELMQGLSVPEDAFKRPWLLDSKRIGFNMEERHATDAPNLDKSVTQGRVSATLSLNVPRTDVGGVIMIILEVMPERLDERQNDPWVETVRPNTLPDALRDIQRPEPVDLVLNRRLDTQHTSGDGLYGYEPMNDKWNRQATRLGGAFYQATPGTGWTEQRSAIWLAEIVNPAYTADHFLAPANFPHNVFSDPTAPAFEFVARHNLTIVGLTQIGDVLSENNDDYQAVQDA